MLTPKFEIKQDDTFVILEIIAPFTKVSQVEVFVENQLFTFYAKPYYLRLEFLQKLLDEGSSTKYICDDGKYEIKLKKAQHGQLFENLDLLTTLLQHSKKHKNHRIEVLDEIDKNIEVSPSPDLKDVNWLHPQVISCSSVTFGYGFANQKSNILSDLQEELTDLVYLQNPDETSYLDRKLQRESTETEKFDMDYYLADLYDTEEIKDLLKYMPWWFASSSPDFTAFEKDQLLKFPNKEFILSHAETVSAFLGLVDIIFGYCYDVRSTEDDTDNVESAWTIRTLSTTLSWCDTQINIPEVLKGCYRRALCYPHYRHWKLTKKVIKDMIAVLQGGRRCVLKCFLSIHDKFQKNMDSPCYILNDLYIQDYCVWIQKVAHCDEVLASIAKAIKNTNIRKSAVDLEIDYVEEAARLALEEEESSCQDCELSDAERLADQLKSVTLNESAENSISAENLVGKPIIEEIGNTN